MDKVGVSAGDSRDPNGLPTFLPFPPENLLFSSNAHHGTAKRNHFPDWYEKTAYWPTISVQVFFFLLTTALRYSRCTSLKSSYTCKRNAAFIMFICAQDTHTLRNLLYLNKFHAIVSYKAIIILHKINSFILKLIYRACLFID